MKQPTSVFALLLAGVLLGCSAPPRPCGPTSCAGCCTGAGECVLAPSAVSCGGSGSSCRTCEAGQTCVSGLCASAGVMPGGTGGGSAAGGGSAGANSVSGNVNGRPFQVGSGAAQRYELVQGAGFRQQFLMVRLSEWSSTCNGVGGVSEMPGNTRVIDMTVASPINMGPVDAGQQTASVIVMVAECITNNRLVELDRADAMPVTLTSVDGRVKGSISGTLRSGAPLAATFDVEYCAFVNTNNFTAINCRP